MSDWSSDVCSSDLGNDPCSTPSRRGAKQSVGAVMTRSASAAMAASADPTLIEKIRTIVGPNGVLTGEDVSGREPGFFLTRIDAGAIVRPDNPEVISQLLAPCNLVGTQPVLPGGVSGWACARQPRH